MEEKNCQMIHNQEEKEEIMGNREMKSFRETSDTFEICLKDQVSPREKFILKEEVCSSVVQAGLQRKE